MTAPIRLCRVVACVAALLLGAIPSVASSQDDASPKGERPDPAGLNAAIQKSKRKPPEALTTYKGRAIAQTMHFTGAEWLVRNEREREERCSLMMAQLGIKPGMAVCDMGCGNGFYTLQMAKMTGKDGQVYAVDIQPEMLTFLNERAFYAGIDNITPVLGIGWDPRLPKGEVDLMLLVDVYHEFSYPEQMLAAIRRSLAPGGTIVLVEFRAEDPNVPIKPEHKMTKKQIMKEMTPNGFKLVKEFNRLPWQHMMWFGRNDDPAWKDIKTPLVEESAVEEGAVEEEGADEDPPRPDEDAPPDEPVEDEKEDKK